MPPPSIFFHLQWLQWNQASIFVLWSLPPNPKPLLDASMARQPVTVGRHFNLVTLPQVGANYHFKRMGLLRSVPVARSPPSSAALPNCLAMLIRAPGPSLNSRVPPYWTKLFAGEKGAPSLVIPYKQSYVLICVKTAQSDGNPTEETFQSLLEGGLWEKHDFEVSGRLHVFFSQSSRLNQTFDWAPNHNQSRLKALCTIERENQQILPGQVWSYSQCVHAELNRTNW